MQRHAGQQIGIVVNGEAIVTSARTLAELVAEQGFTETSVATAVNGDFVPRQARGEVPLAPDARVEIVAPRQGG